MLIDPRNNSPFYVGKGCNKRMMSHYTNTKGAKENTKKYNKIQKLKKLGYTPCVQKYAENLTENEAYDIEKRLIEHYGRKDIDPNGILTNITIDCNPPSRVGKTPTTKGKTWDEIHGPEKANKMREEVRIRIKKIHENKRGKTIEEYLGKEKADLVKERWSINRKGRKAWNKGKTKHDDATIARLAKEKSEKLSGISPIDLFGKQRAEEIKHKRSKTMSETLAKKRKIIQSPFCEKIKQATDYKLKIKTRKKTLITDPSGKEYVTDCLGAFCIMYDLNRSGMHTVALGKRLLYRGWTCSYTE